MNLAELITRWNEEEKKPFSGWDFSYLRGKMTEEQPPWSYPERAAQLMRCSSSAIDMGTGGGEFLMQLRKDWPKKVISTEVYPPNFRLATERLKPFGVEVFKLALTENDAMPFSNNEFGLVLNRHSGFNPGEVARILEPGGTLLTEQVHGLSTYDLLMQFAGKPLYPEATPEHYTQKLKAARLTIIDSREWSGKLIFSDVAAIVYYLKAIPWVVPGFSVETHMQYLLKLQKRVDNGEALSFTIRQYLIEARK
jgi:SAM-dependent methyltransferase